MADPATFQPTPEAIEWARRAVIKQLDVLEGMADHREATSPDQAAGMRLAARHLRRTLLGGKGCVLTAFDDRHDLREWVRSAIPDAPDGVAVTFQQESSDG